MPRRSASANSALQAALREKDALFAEKEALLAEKEALLNVIKTKNNIIDFIEKDTAQKDKTIEDQRVRIDSIEAELSRRNSAKQCTASRKNAGTVVTTFISPSSIKRTANSLITASNAQKRRYHAN